MKPHQIVANVTLLAALAFGTVSAQAAGDVAAGHAKAKGCASCHGMDGKGTVPLAGKKAAYLEEQLRAFKGGERKQEMMNMMAKSLSDQDIEDLAAYYASLK